LDPNAFTRNVRGVGAMKQGSRQGNKRHSEQHNEQDKKRYT
jgi:hypothetical protein